MILILDKPLQVSGSQASLAVRHSHQNHANAPVSEAGAMLAVAVPVAQKAL